MAVKSDDSIGLITYSKFQKPNVTRYPDQRIKALNVPSKVKFNQPIAVVIKKAIFAPRKARRPLMGVSEYGLTN